MVFPRTQMGEGFAQPTPHPIIACGSIEQPSPARGEGTITLTELAARAKRRGFESNDVKQPVFPSLPSMQYVVNRKMRFVSRLHTERALARRRAYIVSAWATS